MEAIVLGGDGRCGDVIQVPRLTPGGSCQEGRSGVDGSVELINVVLSACRLGARVKTVGVVGGACQHYNFPLRKWYTIAPVSWEPASRLAVRFSRLFLSVFVDTESFSRGNSNRNQWFWSYWSLDLRNLLKRPSEFEVVAINDLTDNQMLGTLLKYDSVHGRFDGTVTADDTHLTVNGTKILCLSERDLPSCLGLAKRSIS